MSQLADYKDFSAFRDIIDRSGMDFSAGDAEFTDLTPVKFLDIPIQDANNTVRFIFSKDRLIAVWLHPVK